MNIAAGLERSRRFHADRPALVFGDRSWTYEELDRQASRMAHALRQRGVKRGERVAIFLPNVPEFVFAYLGVQKLGAIAVSLNVMLQPAEVGFILDDSSPLVLITHAPGLAQLPELPSRLRLLVAGVDPARGESLAAAMDGAPDSLTSLDVDPTTPAALLYTSGTTGFPKGATLSHANVVSNVWATQHCTGMTPNDRLLLFLPLFHCFGQNFILNAGLHAGATIVLQERFDPERALAALRDQAITMFFAVPTIFIAFLNARLPPDTFAANRYHFSAAATLPREIAMAWEKRYGHTIWEGYGLTETSPFACYNHRLRHKLGTLGEPIENVEMRILREDGTRADVGEWGEIVVRGPNVMLGYWNRPAETAEAIRDGWFHSGDIGFVDEDGYFSICDRLKDMVITSGFNVYPAEVENVLYAHPAVAEVAVYGAPDPLKGEVVKASIVVTPGASPAPDEIVAWCRERMAAYKVPRIVELVDEIPKNPTGKVLKRVLRDRA